MSEKIDCREYRAAMAAFVREAVDITMIANDPIYASFSRERLPEDVTSIGVEVDESTTESPSVRMVETVETDREDVLSGNLEEFHLTVNRVASTYLATFMPALLEHIGRATDAVGNSVDVSGEALTWDTILDQLETVEWAEDNFGFVQPPNIYYSDPEDLYRRLGAQTTQHKARWTNLRVAKQEEHVSRRGSRRLR